jgi:transposase InsO family protein
MPTALYRRYDHRIRNLIACSKDPYLFPKLHIPISTARSWIRRGPVDVVSVTEFDQSNEQLQMKIAKLEKELEEVRAETKLISSSIKIFGFVLQYKRLPGPLIKEAILKQLKMASKVVPLMRCLEIVGLSSARYYSWQRRQLSCKLEDVNSCPRSSPQRITFSEIQKMKSYLTDMAYAHFSILSLSWLAKRSGDVFASPSSWSRIVREYGLNRKQKRIYPAKPKIGVRALNPGQIWHLDLSVIKLIDGSRCYIQAVLDNYSRYVLAWKVSRDYGGIRSKDLLERALTKSVELGLPAIPNVWCDSGCENINGPVTSLVTSGKMSRTIAQLDVEQSNSMIESLFHRMKHRYLFLRSLSSFELLVKYVDDYIQDSNDGTPYDFLKGATPLEAYAGLFGDSFMSKLATGAVQARHLRLQHNRSSHCGICPA